MSEIEEWKKAKREALALHVKKEQEKLKEVTDKYLVMGKFVSPDVIAGKSFDYVIVDEPFKLDVEPKKSVGFWEDE
ncbi:hypothetical protein UFOVP235_34 [uncultured Caudovirales phage]|uniref:Uncharacterized protein n=1 Tax=uncultured Caudovirales phage TaxID=2100421 RepID=A0A6J7WQL4_9CAUD|nr:hypothetical protein UFOVP235_34 [uncultured Caudovirales phage]